MEKSETLILNNLQINHKIKRIAYQIYENNLSEQEVILAGIVGDGYKLAERFKKELEKISKLRVILCEVKINKRNPRQAITTSLSPAEYQDKAVILVDDVLNSGSTLIYGVKHFLDVPLKVFRTAVLVDRSHKRFPVKADYKGISLSTSLNEVVKVIFNADEDKVVLR